MSKEKEIFLAWAQTDLAALRHNYKTLRHLGGQLLPIIKAEAYGHGMLEIAGELDRLGVKIFGVSDVTEGMELRRNGFKNEILLLESPLPEQAFDIVCCQLIPTVSSIELAEALNKHAKARGQKQKIHIKIDTGMGRLGVWHEDAEDFIRQITGFSNLVIDGILTHFPLADTNRTFTERQIKILEELVDALSPMLRTLRYVHAANSMGLSGYKNKIFNLARPGLMLYGLYPHPKLKRKISLRPVLSVKTRIVHVKTLAKGRGISYGHTFVAKKNIKVATLAIGYSDGYFRCLSNKAAVLIHDQRCPILGNVTMDQIMVDVSKVPTVKVGDIAVLLGRDKKHSIPAEELAQLAGTISYEVVCNLGNRLARIYTI